MKPPTNAVILQRIDTRYSPTCFGTLKCHHQGVNQDPAEIGAQCCRNQRRMEGVHCGRWRDCQDNILPQVVEIRDGLKLYTRIVAGGVMVRIISCPKL
jgi:hypothetical protein